MKYQTWICMECGKTVFFPSVDPETRQVICTFCRGSALEEIPQEQIKAQAVHA